jgi:chromosome segregation ATPase
MTTQKTVTAEDVERWFQEGVAGIDCTDPTTCAKAGSAVLRLRDTAAQVPGLVAELAGVTANFDRAANGLVLATQQVSALQARVAELTRERDEERLSREALEAEREMWRSAESERDALRLTVQRLTNREDEIREERDKALDQRDALRAQVDEARDDVEETDRLYDAVAEALDAAGIPVREDGTQQAERVKELISERDALRAQMHAARTSLDLDLEEESAAVQAVRLAVEAGLPVRFAPPPEAKTADLARMITDLQNSTGDDTDSPK